MAKAKNTTPAADPKEIANAQSMWESFTVFTKWSIVSIVGLLAVMAATLL